MLLVMTNRVRMTIVTNLTESDIDDSISND